MPRPGILERHVLDILWQGSERTVREVLDEALIRARRGGPVIALSLPLVVLATFFGTAWCVLACGTPQHDHEHGSGTHEHHDEALAAPPPAGEVASAPTPEHRLAREPSDDHGSAKAVGSPTGGLVVVQVAGAGRDQSARPPHAPRAAHPHDDPGRAR